MRRGPRATLLLLVTGTAFAIACKEGTRDGAGQAYTATPTPSSSPNATPQPILVGTSAAGAIRSAGAISLYALLIVAGLNTVLSLFYYVKVRKNE